MAVLAGRSVSGPAVNNVENLTLLHPQSPCFPAPETALATPNGLLALGGNLQPDTLIQAYRKGIFPWFSESEPLLWWSPDPRAVIFPDKLHISRRLSRLWRQQRYQITFNQAFDKVLEGCSQPRGDDRGTWIIKEMQKAYLALHQRGHAHSVEIWQDDKVVGGLYGIAVGAVFCGESMFSDVSNASKLALVALARMSGGLKLIDCQIPNPHLTSLGAEKIPRTQFLRLLERYQALPMDLPG